MITYTCTSEGRRAVSVVAGNHVRELTRTDAAAMMKALAFTATLLLLAVAVAPATAQSGAWDQLVGKKLSRVHDSRMLPQPAV